MGIYNSRTNLIFKLTMITFVQFFMIVVIFIMHDFRLLTEVFTEKD